MDGTDKMIRVAKISRNVDNTWTVRVGRQVEHVDTFGKTHGQIFDAIKYALISMRVNLREIDIIELMQNERE